MADERKIARGLVVLLVVFLAGLADSLYLAWHRIALLTGWIEGKSFCTINDVIDCDRVTLSNWGEMLGIPVGGWGAIFYAMCLIMTLILFFPNLRCRMRFLCLLSWFLMAGTAYSVFLFAISLFVIKAVCVLCWGLYIIIAAALAVLMWCAPRGFGVSFDRVLSAEAFRELRADAAAFRAFGTAVVGFLVFALLSYGGIYAFQNALLSRFAMSKVDEWFARQPQVQIRYELGLHYGAEQPKVTIAIFSDFECPFCRRVDKLIAPVLETYADRVEIRFFNFPLDNACNRTVPQQMHANACKMARAVICASEQCGLLQCTNALFQSPPIEKLSEFFDLADKLKVSRERFEHCYVSVESKEALDQQIEEGIRLKVEGTPTIFINGRLAPPIHSTRFFEALLERNL